jgi:hypothetical protein
LHNVLGPSILGTWKVAQVRAGKDKDNMRNVEAPDGIEAHRYYNDGTREWHVTARRVGETWWTNLGMIGHPWLTSEELDARARARVVCPRLGFETMERYRLAAR